MGNRKTAYSKIHRLTPFYRKALTCGMLLIAILSSMPGCSYFSEESRGCRAERKFVHGFAEYNVFANELEGALSDPFEIPASISPVHYIAKLDDRECILNMRGLRPSSVSRLDKKVERNFLPFMKKIELVNSQSVSVGKYGISGIAYWPRVQFGVHDVETGRSGYVTSEYRLRQIDTIASGDALVDHTDRDHIFYDTYCSAERFAEEHKRGYWGLSVERQKMADIEREKLKHFQDKMWEMLGNLEWETVHVNADEMKKIWAIFRDFSGERVIVKAYNFKGDEFEHQYEVILRGVLLTGVKELDSRAGSILSRANQHCYLLKDSVEKVSDKKIKGVLYHRVYSLNINEGAQTGERKTETYRTWQPLAVALGYCLVDHSDTEHPLYESLVAAEELAKRFKMGYWADGRN